MFGDFKPSPVAGEAPAMSSKASNYCITRCITLARDSDHKQLTEIK